MKLHKEARVPTYAYAGDAAVDLTAVWRMRHPAEVIGLEDRVTYGTGLAVTIPEGYAGFIFPRSSIYRTGMSLHNSVGVIDSGYRGEIVLEFKAAPNLAEAYKVGDRIAQMIVLPVPVLSFVEVEELDQGTARGQGRFGSSDKRGIGL